jgi:hypothetical protein
MIVTSGLGDDAADDRSLMAVSARPAETTTSARFGLPVASRRALRLVYLVFLVDGSCLHLYVPVRFLRGPAASSGARLGHSFATRYTVALLAFSMPTLCSE